MDEIKRKDKLFIVVFALCALVMAIANPADYDIRSVAWDIALLIIAASVLFWFLGEIADSVVVGVVGTAVSVSRPKSRNDLIEMAGEMTGIGKESLSKMSDIELAGIVGSVNGSSKQNGDMPPLGVILVASFRAVIKVFVRIYKGMVAAPRAVINLPKTIKRWRKELRKIWQSEVR